MVELHRVLSGLETMDVLNGGMILIDIRVRSPLLREAAFHGMRE
jgi:hypothetical protein